MSSALDGDIQKVPPCLLNKIKKDLASLERQVQAPDHYVKGRHYEPVHVINDWDLNFNLGNVVKYIARYQRKPSDNPKLDLQKALFYLTYELEKY